MIVQRTLVSAKRSSHKRRPKHGYCTSLKQSSPANLLVIETRSAFCEKYRSRITHIPRIGISPFNLSFCAAFHYRRPCPREVRSLTFCLPTGSPPVPRAFRVPSRPAIIHSRGAGHYKYKITNITLVLVITCDVAACSYRQFYTFGVSVVPNW